MEPTLKSRWLRLPEASNARADASLRFTRGSRSVVHVLAAEARIRGSTLHTDLTTPPGCPQVNIHVQGVTSVVGEIIGMGQRDVFLSAVLGHEDARVVV